MTVYLADRAVISIGGKVIAELDSADVIFNTRGEEGYALNYFAELFNFGFHRVHDGDAEGYSCCQAECGCDQCVVNRRDLEPIPDGIVKPGSLQLPVPDPVGLPLSSGIASADAAE